MKIYNADNKTLFKALEETNKEFDGNIIWNREPEPISKNCIRFTIRVEDSSKAGARRGFTGKKMCSACWHVHGTLFDNILKLNSQARIITGGKTVDINGGNWQDWNIGSMMQPLYFSEACECK